MPGAQGGVVALRWQSWCSWQWRREGDRLENRSPPTLEPGIMATWASVL